MLTHDTAAVHRRRRELTRHRLPVQAVPVASQPAEVSAQPAELGARRCDRRYALSLSCPILVSRHGAARTSRERQRLTGRSGS
ncbi:hypothetical protein EMIT0158MI4_90199 [Burkholderia ambifaria]